MPVSSRFQKAEFRFQIDSEICHQKSEISLRYVGDERDLPRAFDGRLQFALVLRAGAGDAPRQDLAALGHEGSDELHIFVIDVVDFVRAKLADLAPAKQRAALSFFLVARFLVAGAAASTARSSLSEWHDLNLPYFESIVILIVRLTGGTALTRLALRRQPALHAPPFRVGAPAGLHGVDDLLVLVYTDDHLTNDDVHHLETAIEFLHQLAATV